MRRWAIALFVLLAGGGVAKPQSGFTTVTGQVLGSNGVPYSSCLGNASFVPASTATLAPTIGGQPFPTVVNISACDASGNLSPFQLADNNQVSDGHTGAASQWNLAFSLPNGTFGFQCKITITGATQNITAALQACAPALPTTTGAFASLTANNVFTGNNAFSGLITPANIDNVLYVCNTAASLYQTVGAALAALPTNGGTIKVCPNYRETFTSTYTIGSTTQGVDLDLTGTDIVITCNITNGTDCWKIGKGGRIFGRGQPTTAGNPSAGGSVLALASTASVSTLVTNADKTGAQEWFTLQGIQLSGSCSATVSNALVEIEGVFDGTILRDDLLYLSNSTLFKIATNASTGTGQLTFYNLWVNGGVCTNAQPVTISGTSTTFPANINWYAGSIVGNGPSKSLLVIDGGISTGCAEINFFGTYYESDSTGTTNGISINNCFNVHIDGSQMFGAGANAPTNAISIGQTASNVTHGISITNFRSNSSTQINNTITGQTWASGIAEFNSYVYGGSPTVNTGGQQVCEECAQGFDIGMDWSGNWHGPSANRGVRTGAIYNAASPAYDFVTSAQGTQGTLASPGIGPTMNVYNGLRTAAAFKVDSAANFHFPTAGVFEETVAPTAVTSADTCYGDSTAHAIKCSYNAGPFNIIAQQSTLTLKKGSGGGNYTNATTTYAVADNTNLCYTVTIPLGWKLGISASGGLSTATAAVVAQAALTDNAACSTANAGILVETPPIQGAAIGVADSFALNWVITGDGAAHNIALQFKTSNAADTASLINSSATIVPTMTFQLSPSN